ncbi:hypothetical protein JHK85_010654 [Glycine max]|nr:hypothetical protein JHK85_010654 [Glycine max]
MSEPPRDMNPETRWGTDIWVNLFFSSSEEFSKGEKIYENRRNQKSIFLRGRYWWKERREDMLGVLPKRRILMRHEKLQGNQDTTAYTTTPDHNIQSTV